MRFPGRLLLAAFICFGAASAPAFAEPFGWACRPKCIDAGVQWDSRTHYLFKAGEYIGFLNGEPEDNYPRPIAGNWTGFPAHWSGGIEAAVAWGSGTIYFFKGDQYVLYTVSSDGRATRGPIDRIADKWNFPQSFSSGINAGVNWGNGKAYFFRGNQYLRYDIASERVDPGFPRPIAGNWSGFPSGWSSGIDAAVNWGNGVVYFFKGREYLRYDTAADRPGRVRPVTEHWTVFEEAPRPDLKEAFVRVPVTVTGAKGIAYSGAMILTHYRPNGAGPFPAVIYSHGRRPDHRAWPRRYREPALAAFWVNRGFAFFYATRLGYGGTGLDLDAEAAAGVGHGPGARAAVEQIIAATNFAKSQPFVDRNRILLVGNSTGGLATMVATGTQLPQGIIAAINLSGGAGGSKSRTGRPSYALELRRLFGEAGRTARIPTLWLYSENDALWGPDLPREWHAAYTKSGGAAELHMLPPIGNDGHILKDRIDTWAPTVTAFVAKVVPKAVAQPLAASPQRVAQQQPAPVPQPAAAQDAAHLIAECDRLATYDMDPDRPASVRGLPLFAIDAPAATAACVAAAKAAPGERRLYYQLGRALTVAKQHARARTAYQFAHQRGHVVAGVALAFMLERGLGGPADAALARQLYEKAAAAGQPTAMRRLALMQLKGVGGPPDAAQAQRWFAEALRGFVKAGAAGSVDAIFLLGVMHENGEGMPRDAERARRFMEQAAQRGHPEAIRRVGALQKPATAPEAPAAAASLTGSWEFGRQTGSPKFPPGKLCDVTLTLQTERFGNRLQACHPNESYWSLDGNELVFRDREGAETTRFQRRTPNRWEGAFRGTSTVHYLARANGLKAAARAASNGDINALYQLIVARVDNPKGIEVKGEWKAQERLYSGKRSPRALVACIDWQTATPKHDPGGAFGFRTGSSARPPASVDVAVAEATKLCEQNGCKHACVVVDRDGRNALQPPPGWPFQ